MSVTQQIEGPRLHMDRLAAPAQLMTGDVQSYSPKRNTSPDTDAAY